MDNEPIDIYQFSARSTDEVFPNIVVLTPNNTLPLIVTVLEEGNIPIIMELGGVRKVVKRMSPSAFNIDKILRTCGSIMYRKSATDEVLVSDIEDYLEVLEWTC